NFKTETEIKKNLRTEKDCLRSILKNLPKKYTETSSKPVTYIQWNDIDTDTIAITCNRTKNSVQQNKIWLNAKQVWELGNNTIDPYFKLIK
ncbi:MAG: hypothetical protein ACWIPJ_04490, partial [Polaribacter sp.]